MARPPRKVIISCAITGGIHTPTMSPALPVTPKEIVARLNEAVRKAIGTPNVSGRLKDLGGYPRSSSPEEMTSKVRSQIQLWKDVADKAGLEKQ